MRQLPSGAGGPAVEVDSGIALEVGAELVVLAGEDGVHDDARQSRHGQTGQRDGEAAQAEDDALGGAGAVFQADGQHQDQRRDQHVAALGEVHLVLHHVPHAHGGDHAVEHQAHAAHGGGGHGHDDGREFRAEGQQNGKVGSQPDDQRIIDLAQGQHAGIFAIGGVGRGAEQGGDGGGQAVTHQGAVQAGVGHIILAHGGGNGAHIADMLHHGRQGNGRDGDDGGEQLAAVKALAENGEHGALPNHRQADPVRLGHFGDQIVPGGGVHDHRHGVGGQNTQQNGDDLHHALAPDIAHHDHQNGDHSHAPVGGAAADGGAGQGQADGDDHRAGDDGREEFHDLIGAEKLEQQGQHQVQQTGDRHAEAGVGQHGRVGDRGFARAVFQPRGDRQIAAQEGEGGAQEGGDLPAGDQMEQQCSQAGEKQGGGDIQAGEGGDQHCGAKHGEQVLHTQNQHFGSAQGPGVIDGVGLVFVCWHKKSSFLPLPILATGERMETATRDGWRATLSAGHQ